MVVCCSPLSVRGNLHQLRSTCEAYDRSRLSRYATATLHCLIVEVHPPRDALGTGRPRPEERKQTGPLADLPDQAP